MVANKKVKDPAILMKVTTLTPNPTTLKVRGVKFCFTNK